MYIAIPTFLGGGGKPVKKKLLRKSQVEEGKGGGGRMICEHLVNFSNKVQILHISRTVLHKEKVSLRRI